MKKVELEKQASSEIAQSRAKSEVLFTRYTGLEIDPIAYDFDDSQREKIFAFTDWCMEAAERDTRERCAQLIEREADEEMPSPYHESRAMKLRELAERIRGKE